MDIIENINFYKFNKNTGVVEIFIKEEFLIIKDKLSDFSIEDKTLSKDNWQIIYMEQYFSKNKMIKICNTYDKPADNTKEFWLVFFIYELKEGQILCTPFGNITVTKLKKLPSEYKKILEFNDYD